MISGFPYKVHEVDPSRVVMKGGTMRRKIRSARCFVHPQFLEQPDLQGRESKIWIIYSEAGASLTIIRLN
ncbi:MULTISPECIES: hypothetical protein [unclassified Bacillus (in: firmicutes)]|uniref:hypothetical protein n=1 Tax=unclassified Bacillus (in: firmicutes) TaxID=185979 RepID=UPI001BE92179|nr:MULTISPECIES: hypothetical protein [unclassified Bacillus (in: firmicutes)]MBT2614896.1 hypothetical protein [Bacillus sp. ISL-78]MBT2631806.1 hypothetical protein [Bacillus sp. ISL-101]